jgi:hypothetical protein
MHLLPITFSICWITTCRGKISVTPVQFNPVLIHFEKEYWVSGYDGRSVRSHMTTGNVHLKPRFRTSKAGVWATGPAAGSAAHPRPAASLVGFITLI